MTDYEILMIGLTFTSLVVTLLIAYIRKSASPIRFLAVDFLVIPEISERYFLHNKKLRHAAGRNLSFLRALFV